MYDGRPPITGGHMVMGVRDVTLRNVIPHLGEGYSLYGENFTKSSKVFVNGVKQKSTFLNNTRIDLPETEFSEDDEIVVIQMGSSNTVFRKSDAYLYQNGELTVQLGTGTDKGKSWVEQLEEEE